MTGSGSNQKIRIRASGIDLKTALKDAALVGEEKNLLMGLLETLSKSLHVEEYMRTIVKHLKKYSGCQCIGIRLLDEEGNIPYSAYMGFSRKFYESENMLCIHSDQCMCINVIRGEFNAGKSFYTWGGSFLSNGTTKLLATVSEEEKGKTRNVCNQNGFESVALVPMRHGDRILGLIHLADKRENMIPEEKVTFLEQIGTYMGQALQTFIVEDALHKSEDKYRHLVENLHEGIWVIDENANTTFVNTRMAEMLGYTVDEMLGRHLFSFMDERSMNLAKLALERRQQGIEERHDFEFIRKNGEPIYTSLDTSPITDAKGKYAGAIAGVQDITDRKKIEDALLESQEQMAATLNALPDLLFEVDRHGNIHRFYSSESGMMFGLPEDFVGKTVGQVLPEHTTAVIMEAISEVVEKGKHTGSAYTLELPTGTHWFELSISTKGDPNMPDGRLIVLSRDITERKKLDEMKDDFIGMVSHELRSPLTVIMGAVHTALEEEARLSPYDRRQLLQDAAQEAETLSHLLGNLLELSRAQADRLHLYVEPVKIANVVHAVVNKTEQAYPGRRIITDLPRRIALVPADQLRLERILYNLVENAAKYSPEQEEIRIAVKQEEQFLVFSVHDKGRGISVRDQARLFEPFQRLEESTIEGIGLGLVLCRNLVEAHGGRIWVESTPGRGATFFFTIPLEQPAAG